MRKLGMILVLATASFSVAWSQDTGSTTTTNSGQTTTTVNPATGQSSTTTTSPDASQATTTTTNPQTGQSTSTTTTQQDNGQATTQTTTTPATTPVTTTTVPQSDQSSTSQTTSTQTTTTSTPPAKENPYRHGEIGAFVDYTRLADANNLNMFGLGGRLAFNVHKHVQLEAQMAYDFEKNTTTTSTSGGSTTFSRTGLRTLQGLFGPKFTSGYGAWRVFGTVQGGFVNFSTSNNGPLAGFTGSVSNVVSGNTNGAVYPGAGFEAFAGPVGIRADVGDLIYFANNGAHNNLKITVGPQFRF